MIHTIDGQEYRFIGYDQSSRGTHFLHADGTMVPKPKNQGVSTGTAWFQLVRRHEHGGVVFEETGEFRAPLRGEWYLTDGKGNAMACHADFVKHNRRIILRAVELKKEEED